MAQIVIHRDPEIQGDVPVFVGTRVPLKNLFDTLEAGEDPAALELAREAAEAHAHPA